jgi:hypothetical protein
MVTMSFSMAKQETSDVSSLLFGSPLVVSDHHGIIATKMSYIGGLLAAKFSFRFLAKPFSNFQEFMTISHWYIWELVPSRFGSVSSARSLRDASQFFRPSNREYPPFKSSQ